MLSGVVVLIAATAATLPAAASSGPAAGGSGLTIATPAAGSVIATGSLAAARAAQVRAALRVGHRLQGVSVRLNGRLVTLRPAGGGVLHALLVAGDGLRPGVNQLQAEATAPGASVPVTAVSQFTITYPATGLAALSLTPGQGPGALPRPVLHVPASGLSALSVTLNGTDVTGALLSRAGTSGTRRLELSAAGPLRWGPNTLRVRAVMYDGRAQTVTRSFTLNRRRDIAGLRLLAPAHVGQAAHLDAGASRIAGGKLDPAAVRWALVRKPAKSRISLSGQGTGASLTPDAPGRYVVRVTVGTGAAVGSATLTVTATYPGPLVPLNTIDDGNPAALAVGSDRYAVSGGLQVNVLDRTSLEYLAGQGFDTNSAGIAAMGTYLAGLPDSDLVFVTHPSTSPAIAASDIPALNTALGHIGGSYPGSWQLNLPGCWSGGTQNCHQNNNGWQHTNPQPAAGSFSIAGVPGMQAGQAWRATAAQSHSAEGRITGYLTQGIPAQTGSVDGYVINAGADQYAQVDTCASGGPSECVIKVGSQTFAPAPEANGFNVVTLDRTTLAPISHTTATTAGALVGALEHLTNLTAGRQLLNQFVDDQTIAIIQSVGTGILPPSSSDPYPFIDYYGGTPELLKAAITDGTPYAMVGVANNLPWHGTATESSPLAAKQQTGQLRTVLSRDRNGLLTPGTGDAWGKANLDLYSIMYQNPTPWPYADDTTELKYIADGIDLPAYPDVRSAYTDLLINWSDEKNDLDGLTCTDPSACGPNFDAVKQQLLQEFDWVDRTKSLIDSMEKPIDQTSESPQVSAQQVYDEIENTILPPPQSDTNFGWLGMFDDVTNLASAAATATGQDEAAAAVGLMSAVGSFAADSTATPDGDSTDVLAGQVDNLDQQLYNQQNAEVEGLNNLETILLTDAGKLQAVGTAIGVDKAWDWTSQTNNADITALNAAARSASYTAMLPPAWPVWNLQPDNVTQTSSDDVSTYGCWDIYSGSHGAAVPAFGGALPANQLHAVTSVASQQPVSQVWTFANIYGSFWHDGTDNTVPNQSLTDDLTSTNALTGAFQYLPQWIRTTYNPPGLVVCTKCETNTYITCPQSGEQNVADGPPVIPNADAAKNQ